MEQGWKETRDPSSSALTIDYASSFDFSSNKISSSTETYKATAQKYKDANGTEKTGPNYVQVTDSRAGATDGWTLKVEQPTAFKANKSGKSLDNTKIIISNGTYVAGELQSNVTATDSVTIEPGQGAQTVMSAPDGQGRGTSLYTMGDTGTAIDSVKLEVPGSSVKEADTYTTKLTWTLSNGPIS